MFIESAAELLNTSHILNYYLEVRVDLDKS